MHRIRRAQRRKSFLSKPLAGAQFSETTRRLQAEKKWPRASDKQQSVRGRHLRQQGGQSGELQNMNGDKPKKFAFEAAFAPDFFYQVSGVGVKYTQNKCARYF